MRTITIRVEGGVVQSVEDVPEDVTVRVVDYDVEGVPDDECDHDDAGEPCCIALHDGSAS